MPTNEDLKIFAIFLRRRIKEETKYLIHQKLMGKLKEEKNQKRCRILICLSLVFFIMFNRKRSGESKWILLKDFQDAKKNDLKEDTELFSKLSKLEQRIASRHLLMKIIGKVLIIIYFYLEFASCYIL